MMLAFPVVLALVHRCAAQIAPEAIISIVSVESSFDPLAINVNHVGRVHARTAEVAAATAARWISAGYSADLGLAQINSKNLGWTGLSIADAFTPCANLAAAEKILQLGYARALRQADGLDAISETFSLYNSGNICSGFHNDYVARVWHAATQVVPKLIGTANSAALAALADGGTCPSTANKSKPTFVLAPGDGRALIFK